MRRHLVLGMALLFSGCVGSAPNIGAPERSAILNGQFLVSWAWPGEVPGLAPASIAQALSAGADATPDYATGLVGKIYVGRWSVDPYGAGVYVGGYSSGGDLLGGWGALEASAQGFSPSDR